MAVRAEEKKTEEMSGPMIYRLIAQAMSEIGAIGKDSSATNYSGKLMYKFRGIDAVYNALNPVMAKLGLFIIPDVIEQQREERLSSNNTPLIYSILKVHFTMYAPDGSNVQGTTMGEGMDSGDKSINKAMSAAMKYFCFQTFMIPTEDLTDPDAEVHEVAPRGAQQRAAQAPARQTPARTQNAQKAPNNGNVTTQATVPQVNPVQAYINNEMAFMAQRFEISDRKQMGARFAQMRNALIQGGVVPNIESKDLTMEQAHKLIDAIYATYLTDGGKAS